MITMVVVDIFGGMGNQMFAYAFGRSVSLDLDEELFFDISFYNFQSISDNQEIRRFELDKFNISGQIINECVVEVHNNSGSISKVSINYIKSFFNQLPYFNRLSHFCGKLLMRELTGRVIDWSLKYDGNINKCIRRLHKNGKNIHIGGFWQSEKYFSHNSDNIVTDFQFKIPPSQENIDWIKLIQNTNSIGIHFRRTDYVSFEKEKSTIWGVLTLDYYQKSIDYIKERIESPSFFIFSDDINYVKTHYNFTDEVYYVNLNDSLHAYEDLRLMTYCKHFIIANSTFSWWGAWLGADKNNGIVIAPKKFLNSINTDIIPERWVKMDNSHE